MTRLGTGLRRAFKMAEGYGRLQPIMTRFWLELSGNGIPTKPPKEAGTWFP